MNKYLIIKKRTELSSVRFVLSDSVLTFRLPIQTKKPRLFSRGCFLYISTLIKRWFLPCGFFHCSTIVSSAISFCLPSDSIPADASSDSPLSSACASDFLWAVHSTTCAASFPLSDPLCFGSLSVTSVSGSDYSASVLPFLFLPVSASQWLPRCARVSFGPLAFPVLSDLVSRVFLLGSSYSALLFVSFRPSLLRSHSWSTSACLPISLPTFSTSVPLPFVCFTSASGYSAFCPSFPSLPGSAFQLLPRCPSPLSLPRFPSYLRPDFSCLPSDFSYSALLLVSFRSALLRSRSRSTGDPLSDFSSGAGA